MRRSPSSGILLAVIFCTQVARAEDHLAFFESRIRPVLVEHCYGCHNASKSADGGLALDSRAGLLEGGDGGEIVVPGKPAESRLLAILKHEVSGLKMPKGAGKLDATVIADFERWIASGAIDPRESAPTREDLVKETSWASQLERRKQWWSFQPVQRTEPPPVRDPSRSSNHPVDRFIQATLEAKGLQPAPQADRRTLLRRTYFTLTGLPPSPEETGTFLNDNAPDAYERLVDKLLDSPRFGERWGRHWLDLVRYCESHGSQGDPELPNAYKYRDYVIRAINADVPYDQFVREQIAGDLLPTPRLDVTGELSESALGTSQLRMGEFGYIPVDALEDQVKVVDNQIDVFSKTFLGLTVSCARCHDHKFDAISQKDFYALYGVFASCRPGQIAIDAPGRLDRNKDQLAMLKTKIRSGLADAWQAAVPDLIGRINKHEQVVSERTRIEERLRQVQSDVGAIVRPAETAILKARGRQVGAGLPDPMARWSFSQDARDTTGKLDGTVEGAAAFQNGRLVLNGKDVRVRTGPLPKDVREKTLEAWVTLANLDQRGVGVIALESDEGARFDSIVFSEMDKGVWIAGSDYFKRTQVPGGPPEQADPSQLIHMAIVYGSDNSITIYRNGVLYGTAYAKGELQTFEAGKARVLIGQRHPLDGIPRLAGEIDELRLYDRPLTPQEVATSFQAGPGGVTRQEILDSLAAGDVQKLKSLEEFQATLQKQLTELKQTVAGLSAAFEAAKKPGHPLGPWVQFSSLPEGEYATAWTALQDQWKADAQARAERNRTQFRPAWDLTAGDLADWFAAGTGLTGAVSPDGEFTVEREGDRVVRGVYQAGVYSHLLSRKHNGVLTSPRFVISSDSVSIRALGENSMARLVIENYVLGGGGIYPATRLNRDEMGWIRLDTSYRKGAHAYVEFTTENNDRAGFGAAQVVFHDGNEPPSDPVIATGLLLSHVAPTSPTELASLYSATLLEAISAFKSMRMSPEQARFLDDFVRSGLLPVTLAELPAIGETVNTYRQLEREVPLAQLAPGFQEAAAFDQPLFTRGRHTQPVEPVARRFLESLGGTAYATTQSGRLQLANEVASPTNPLTARVMVNRVWHHVFGKGLVATVDNFGRLGEKPTHPELLDYLASRFVADQQWSLKKLLKFLLTTETYQQSALASAAAQQADGNNAWLSHANVTRLEAEAIRDTILAASGQLDLKMYGPGPDVYHVSKTEGGGPKGPLDGDRRRSVYLRIRRNAHNPFLEVFDAPKPTTTRGKRDVTNVPAQSLTMLNDPFVIDQAAKWANALVSDGLSTEQRIRGMFRQALARDPQDAELAASQAFVKELAADHGVSEADIPGSKPVWQDFAQAIFCLKEFIYVD